LVEVNLMPTYNYWVSFESDTLPVRTLRGEVVGGVGTAARRAIEDAKTQVPGKVHFRSVVVVLEKADSSSNLGQNMPIQEADYVEE
jgi:hypothetical protein